MTNNNEKTIVSSKVYKDKKSKRLIQHIRYSDGTRKTRSYPRTIMEEYLGRPLLDDETVDHIDGNVENNDISNLQLLSREENARKGALGNKHTLGRKQSEEHKRNGAKNGQAKLTNEQVIYYRKSYEDKSLTKNQIIELTNMSRPAIENILNYKSYVNTKN
jgi:hypothetical protein